MHPLSLGRELSRKMRHAGLLGAAGWANCGQSPGKGDSIRNGNSSQAVMLKASNMFVGMKGRAAIFNAFGESSQFDYYVCMCSCNAL